jgi:tetratricopeptide (TPR) repeat protein
MAGRDTTMDQFNIQQFKPDDLEADQLVYLARVAETAERYDDMCQFVKLIVQKFAKDNEGLNVEQRNLLSVAYKNVVGARRASWRMINAETREESLVKVYRGQIESELRAICKEVLVLLDENLLPVVKGKNDESEVFFLKMAGDYYRYLCEFAPQEGNEDKAREHYAQAMDIAKDHLAPTHPTRLGLALNYSVCFYEILKDKKAACDLAKEAFDSAIEKLDTLGGDSDEYRDSTLIMQLLRDNLTLWNSEENDDTEAQEPAE